MEPPTMCQICTTTEFKYTCPRCNKLYCSITCYRSPDHQQCSEAFYRECVVEEASARSADPQNSTEIHRMLEILQRVNDNSLDPDCLNEAIEEEAENLDSDDEDDDSDLATRIEGVNLDDPEAVWQCLTANEKQEFEALLKTGEISKLLPEFRPWWEIKIPKKLIEDVDVKSEPVKLKHPKLLANISPFETLTKKQPSPCLPHNLYNILSAYTCTVRFYNGEHLETSIDSANFLISHAATLSSNANFDNNEQAVKSILTESTGTEGIPSWQSIASDVENILQGPEEARRDPLYVEAALSDIHVLLKAAVKLSKEPSLCDSVDKKKLSVVSKKIEFFLAFVRSTK